MGIGMRELAENRCQGQGEVDASFELNFVGKHFSFLDNPTDSMAANGEVAPINVEWLTRRLAHNVEAKKFLIWIEATSIC